MYEAFYGLTEKPFNLTPDPRFLYLSEKHKEAFAHLLFGIKNRTGFVMVSGEIGTGKTTICRSLLSQVDPDTEVSFIFNPLLSPEELLRGINEDFGIESHGQTTRQLIDELNAYLLDRNAHGKNCVLVIDEAQNLAPGVLEQIRLLSNLETETQKLLQIVLIGQPELAELLELPELRQLNQRITARYHLRELDEEETLQYIAYRLRVAGGRRKVRFARKAIRLVYKFSGGTPRVINAICDRALLIGYTKETRDIDPAIVKQAMKEIRGEKVRMKRRPLGETARKFLPSPTIVVTALVILVLVRLLLPSGFLRSAMTPPEASPDASANRTAEAVRTMPEPPSPAVAEPAGEVAQPPPLSSPNPAELSAAQIQEASDVLAGHLAALTATTARNNAVAGVFQAWNATPSGRYPLDDSVETLRAFGQSNGFAVEILAPTLDELLAIDLPAVIRVRGAGIPLWIGLVKNEDGLLGITSDAGKTIETPKAALQSCYAGEALVFWRDTAPNSLLLTRAMQGEPVAALQSRLAALGRLSGPPSGVYDDETVRAIAKLQVETGLKIDGIAGQQVRMVLGSWLPEGSVPALRARAVSAPEASIETPRAAEPTPATETSTGAVPPEPDATGDRVASHPADFSTPLPEFLTRTPDSEQPAPADLSDGVLWTGRNPSGTPWVPQSMVSVEELPPPGPDDTLPPKIVENREVTPPLTGVAPIVPREAPAEAAP